MCVSDFSYECNSIIAHTGFLEKAWHSMYSMQKWVPTFPTSDKTDVTLAEMGWALYNPILSLWKQSLQFFLYLSERECSYATGPDQQNEFRIAYACCFQPTHMAVCMLFQRFLRLTCRKMGHKTPQGGGSGCREEDSMSQVSWQELPAQAAAMGLVMQ